MKTITIAACFGIMGLSAAQVARYCPAEVTGICYSVNIPSDSASKNSGDIYLQIKGPSSNQWIGLGQSEGAEMAGSNMFIIYGDENNKNVTLSPRLGTGEVMPLHDTTAKVTLLDGSGIENNIMIANIRCSNCDSWQGGTLSYTSTSSSWIWASKGGDSLASNDESATIITHDQAGSFTLDLTAAKGGSSSNPFTVSSTSPSGPDSPSNSSSPAAPSSASTSNVGSSSSGSVDQTMSLRMQIAHGTLMGLSMVILFPVGVMIRRIAPGSSIWLHASIQMFAWIVALIGMGLGIWLALNQEQLSENHSIIGLVVVCGISLQPLGGLLQHSYYRKHGRRGPFGYAHIVIGMCLIVIGTINGGLGLQLADEVSSAITAYAVVVAVLFLVYAGIVALTAVKGRGGQGRGDDKSG